MALVGTPEVERSDQRLWGHNTPSRRLICGATVAARWVMPSQVDDYCEDIHHVARTLGVKRLVLVGLSYGSWIATSYALRHGDMMAGLVWREVAPACQRPTRENGKTSV